MQRIRRIAILAPALLVGCQTLPAQRLEWKIAGQEVQFHGFISQGFAYSNDNNYLTMQTSRGTFAMTEGAINAAAQLTDKLRVGAQVYTRNIGQLGRWQPEVDWALADYRFQDWFGVRGGKVKTRFGLYNDSQDEEFLRIWAILPQSVYPMDLRASRISHNGADAYGTLPLQRAGSLSYTVYAGTRPYDTHGGYRYSANALGLTISTFHATTYGADLRWNAPLDGLLAGASYIKSANRGQGLNAVGSIYEANQFKDVTTVIFAQFQRAGLLLETEYSREVSTTRLTNLLGAYGPPVMDQPLDGRAFYAAASYRLTKYLEVGSYHSRFYPDADRRFDYLGRYLPAPARHIYDQAVTARIDIRSHCSLKFESHFMDGYNNPLGFRGFYPQQNPAGLKPKTNMLVIRLGYNL